MRAAPLLAELRARGVAVAAAGDKLRYRPAGSVPPDLVARLRACKAELIALLLDEEAAVAWRAAAMRGQAAGPGPLPFLVARRATVPDPACQSCGDPIGPAVCFARCRPCALARSGVGRG